jgi:hypothetical protein
MEQLVERKLAILSFDIWVPIFRWHILFPSLEFKMDSLCRSKTLIIIYQNTRCHNPENSNIQLHRHEKLKFNWCTIGESEYNITSVLKVIIFQVYDKCIRESKLNCKHNGPISENVTIRLSTKNGTYSSHFGGRTHTISWDVWSTWKC